MVFLSLAVFLLFQEKVWYTFPNRKRSAGCLTLTRQNGTKRRKRWKKKRQWRTRERKRAGPRPMREEDLGIYGKMRKAFIWAIPGNRRQKGKCCPRRKDRKIQERRYSRFAGNRPEASCLEVNRPLAGRLTVNRPAVGRLLILLLRKITVCLQRHWLWGSYPFLQPASVPFREFYSVSWELFFPFCPEGEGGWTARQKQG